MSYVYELYRTTLYTFIGISVVHDSCITKMQNNIKIIHNSTMYSRYLQYNIKINNLILLKSKVIF